MVRDSGIHETKSYPVSETTLQAVEDKNPSPFRKLKTYRTPDIKGVTVFLIYEDEHKNNYIQDKQVEKSTFRRGYKSGVLYISAA